MRKNQTPNQRKRRRIVAAILIAVLLVFLMGAVLVLRCLTFDDSGAHVIDRYGVLAQEQESDSQLSAGSGSAQDEGAAEAEPEQIEEPEKETAAETRAVLLTADAVTDADVRSTLKTLAENKVLDTVVVNIKDSDGKLYLPCDTDLVDTEDWTDNADALAGAIGELQNAGLQVVGRICCLHDQKATEQQSDLAIQYINGGTWLDYDNTRWLDPTDSDAVQYLCDIARSAVNVGCDALVLDDFTFPPRGHLDRAEFDETPADQASVLLDALQQIQQAVGSASVGLMASDIDALTALSENGEEDGIAVGDVGQLLDAAKFLAVPLQEESADGVAAMTEVLHAAALQANALPIFDDPTAWKDYSGSAVLDASGNSSLLSKLS